MARQVIQQTMTSGARSHVRDLLRRQGPIIHGRFPQVSVGRFRISDGGAHQRMPAGRTCAAATLQGRGVLKKRNAAQAEYVRLAALVGHWAPETPSRGNCMQRRCQSSTMVQAIPCGIFRRYELVSSCSNFVSGLVDRSLRRL